MTFNHAIQTHYVYLLGRLAIKDLWGGKLKAKVEGRDGTLVVRPDSGHPPEVVIKCLELLGAAFGVLYLLVRI